MNILVTGASGFVGRHLIGHLAKNKNNRITATTTRNSFEELPLYENVRWIHLDIRNEELVQEVFKTNSFNQMYHLAGIASPNSKEYKIYYDTNVLGTLNLLESIWKYSSETKSLIVSSSHVYGIVTSEDLPIKETTKLNPSNHYASSKAAMELATYPYIDKGLNIVIARPFNHTGIYQTAQYVCSDFAYQFALMRKKLKPSILHVGNIDVLRDFMDVSDVIKAYDNLMNYSIKSEIINVCSCKGISLRSIIKELEEISGVEVEIRQQKHRFRCNDVRKIVGSNEKINKIVGWKPEIKINETLKSLYEYWLGKVK